MARRSRHTLKGTLHTICRMIGHGITAAQILCVGMLWLCAASVYVSPAKCSWMSVIGLGFPFLIVLVTAVLTVALLLTPRRAWISMLGLIACCGSIRNYAPINMPSTPPDDAWHVMSWNVGGAPWNDSTHEAMRDFLFNSELDILGLQELGTARAEKFKEVLAYRMPYLSNISSDDDCTGLCLYSRWPIVGKELICRSNGNMAQAYQLLLAPEDTLIVVNCHLQSMHIDTNTRTDYAAIMHREQTNSDTVEVTYRTLVRQIRENSAVRALQVDTLADYLQRHSSAKLILMGDFNDTPISYTRQHLIKAAPLTDCFRESGIGIGRTFNRHAIYVRIDHIMASAAFYKPYDTRVIPTKLSDHNAIDTYLMPLEHDK